MKRYLPILTGLAIFANPVFVVAQQYIDLEADSTPVVVSEQVTATETTVNFQSTDAITQAPASSSGNLGEMFYQVQLLQEEVRQLRGQLEDQSHQIRQLKQQSLERYVDLDRRLGEGVAAAGSRGAQPTNAGQPKPAAKEIAGEGNAYHAAYSLVRSQRFKEAVGAFKRFLVDFPDGRYAPNAYYWLGELYQVMTPPDLESSRQSFVLLLEQYPGHSKEPDTLYKLGKVYFQKGNADRAKDYLKRVIEEYGDSNHSAVKLTRDFLAENY